MIRSLRAAFGFLTRIPAGGFPFTPEELRGSAAFFPLVGALLGAVTGGVQRALLPLGSLAAALIAVALQLLLTGAFHEDGLADTCDALGGGYTREKVLEILKDSRAGSFGASALVISIATRAALGAQLGTGCLWGWAWAGCVARLAPVALMAAMPYASRPEQAKSREVTRAGIGQVLGAAVWVMMLGAALVARGDASWARLVAGVGLSALATGLCAWRFWKRLGGVTGDFLGATEQVCEIALLASLVWRA